MKRRWVAWLLWGYSGFAAADMPCPLWEVWPPGMVIGVSFKGDVLPRASLVQTERVMVCQAEHEVAVRVRSVNHWYRPVKTRPPDVGAVACVDRSHLRPVQGKQLLGIGPPVDGGTRGSALELGEYTTARIGVPTCGEQSVPMRPEMSPMSLASLVDTRAIDRSQVALVRSFGGQPEPFREPGVTPIQMFSDWGGFVSMPVVHELTADERREQWQAESLVTKKQREKATVAIGQRSVLDGEIYTRFLGSDERRSDRWGTPHTIRTLVSLAGRWYAFCTEELPLTVPSANPRTCTVQYGDVAYFVPAQPDPLGHTTHHTGRCVDIRLFRSDGSRYEAYWNRGDDRAGRPAAYDAALTGAFLRFATEQLTLEALYFNDPALLGTVPGLEPHRGHDDHIHLCVAPEQDGG